MSTSTITPEGGSTPEKADAPAKSKRKSATRPKPAKKPARAKKPASKAKPDRANKKAEVIAKMKRGKGATLAEIMKATGWQAHTVRASSASWGSKGGQKIESSKSPDGERTYKIK